LIVLSVGLGRTPELNIPGEEHVLDGIAYVEGSKIGAHRFKVGKDVLVIGAGTTAIDCATIAKRLGAESVTILYRRTAVEMTAYRHEFEFALNEGIQFRFLTLPVRVVAYNGKVTGLECARVALGAPDASGRPGATMMSGSEFTIPADQIVKATGQEKPPLAKLLGIESDRGFIRVNTDFETNLPGVFAIGDCIRAKGAASTVMAVQDGKLAAQVIHQRLAASSAEPRVA
jgi:dihydropyrimidine dehydrogenase (NAD+) subunit PreT